MEIKDVFISGMVIVVAIVGVLAWISSLNNAYDTTVGSTFNTTMNQVQTVVYANLSGLAVSTANNTQVAEGGGSSDQQASITSQSGGSLRLATRLLGIIPSIIDDGAQLLGIPAQYTLIARYTFLFVFGITIAYILYLGVRSLL
jgi:hypothetical protein